MVKIGDFGGAKEIDPNNPDLTKKVGTPFYLSPEMIQDKPYSFKADIWALGIILYEICALKLPFLAEDEDELIAKILKGKYRRIPSHYGMELWDIINKCLNKDPKRRPSISEIISSESFQKKSKLLKLPLPKLKHDRTFLKSKPLRNKSLTLEKNGGLSACPTSAKLK